MDDFDDARTPRKVPRPKPPGSTDPSRPGRVKPTGEETWRRPTEPDEPAASPQPKAKTKEPRVVHGDGPKLVERILFGKVGSAHLAMFCRQFAAYSEAGVDLLKSLAAMEKQFGRTALGPVLGRVITQVRQGETLAEAFGREPKAFDSLFLSMVRVAEARGGIPETMKGMADHYDARVRLIRQARSAMIYPIIVLVLVAGVMALMTVWILPMFASLLGDITRGQGESSLPLPSQILMGFSRFVAGAGWWLVPLITVGLIVGAFQLYKTPGGKAAMDEVGLHLPVLGKLLRLLETTRFARTLGSLLGAGVDIGSSMDLTAGVLRLAPFRRAIQGAKANVLHGTDLSEALDETRRFNSDVIAILNSGEETGMLPESLGKLADDYEERVTYMVKNLGQLIQPILLVLLGGIVLFVILAVFLPYLSIITSLTR